MGVLNLFSKIPNGPNPLPYFLALITAVSFPYSHIMRCVSFYEVHCRPAVPSMVVGMVHGSVGRVGCGGERLCVR